MHKSLCVALAVVWLSGVAACADDPATDQESPAAAADPVPLNPQQTVLLDLANRKLLLKTKVVLREGVLEMLICKTQTKEHESILSVDSEAYLIHAGLLALGAKPGTPAGFEVITPTEQEATQSETPASPPEYKFHPPTGQEIDITFHWIDESGRPQQANARKWVRHVTRRYYEHPLAKVPAGVNIGRDSDLRYDEKHKLLIWFGQMTAGQRDELLRQSTDEEYQAAIQSFFDGSQSREIDAKWVFAGSGFYEYEDGTQSYMAESGNVVCVANFGDALLDVTVESSSSNDGLLYEPYTERIPPLGTDITVELSPAKNDSKQP